MSLHRFPNAERHSEVDVIIPECRTAFALQIRNLCRSPLNFSLLFARIFGLLWFCVVVFFACFFVGDGDFCYSPANYDQ